MPDIQKRTVHAYAGDSAAQLILEHAADGVFDFAFEGEDIFKDEYPSDEPTEYKITIHVEKV
jgi:hypothetical protein